jgi:hypothetical protein
MTDPMIRPVKTYCTILKQRDGPHWVKLFLPEAGLPQVKRNIDKCLFFGQLSHDPESKVLVDKCRQVSVIFSAIQKYIHVQ